MKYQNNADYRSPEERRLILFASLSWVVVCLALLWVTVSLFSTAVAIGLEEPPANLAQVAGGKNPNAYSGEVDATEKLAPKYKAETEVRQWDGVRCDMVSDEYAIEVEFPKKWAESIGQSLYYATLTHRKPGIILLVRDRSKEARYIYRCQTVAARCGIDVWLEPYSER